MDVRTFEAHSMREALKAVKKTFGVDAVILKTENTTANDGHSKVIKITATQASEQKTIGASADSRGNHLDAFTAESESVSWIKDELRRVGQQAATKDQLEQIEGSLDELKLILLEGQREAIERIADDAPASVQDVARQLRLTCVDEAIVVELLKYLRDLPGPGKTKEDRQKVETEKEYYLNASIKWALKRVKIAPKWSVMPGHVSMHAFMGSTGVGKTSIIAKLAAHYKKTEHSNVLIISYDKYRVAASEQLRILAKALNVHFETIDDLTTIPDVIEKYEDLNLVLIDTAGRSTKSKKQMDELEQLSELPLPIEKHLVLSMVEKQVQMDRAIRFFSNIGINSLVFNKLDQSWSYGEILNLMHKWALPTSFFGVGQDVPGDFERASRERVIERIFGL